VNHGIAHILIEPCGVGYWMRCRHCTLCIYYKNINLSITASQFAVLADDFVAKHRDCMPAAKLPDSPPTPRAPA